MNTSQDNIGKLRGSCADYNGNNTWYFNGGNGMLNNNNRYNGNFRSRPALDYDQYDNELLESYLIPLSDWLWISHFAAAGKRRKPSYVYASLSKIDGLIKVCHEVGNFEVLPTESTAHIIFEPRVREIVCAAVSKRDIQAFYIRTLQPYLEQYMYHPDSFSCRPGKGGLRAVQQLQEYVFEESNGYTEDVWLAKVDLKAFFMNINCFQICDIVINFIDTYMVDSPYRELMKYLTRIIYLAATKDHLKDMARPDERQQLDPQKSMYNCPYYIGVPIGDWTSQTGGLIITTEPLRYIASLGYKFVHYTDDTCIVVRDKRKWLDEDLPRLELFYREKFGLTLHQSKRYLQHYSKGVELLGYKVRFNRLLPSDRIYHNLMWYLDRTIRKATENIEYAIVYKDKILSSVNSYLGMLRNMSGYNLRVYVCDRIATSPLSKVFEPAKDFTKISIRPEYSDKSYYAKELKKLKLNSKFVLS